MQKYYPIIGVITLRLDSERYSTVQKRYSIGPSTVTLIMNWFKESELSLDDLKQMEPKKVGFLFYPEENLRRKDVPLPYFNAIYQKMVQMKHPDLSYLWLEYKEKNPDGY